MCHRKPQTSWLILPQTCRVLDCSRKQGKREPHPGVCSLRKCRSNSKKGVNATNAVLKNNLWGIVLLCFPPPLPLNNLIVIILFPKTTNLRRWWAYLWSCSLKSQSSGINLVAVSTDTLSQGSGRELNILFQLWSLDFSGSSRTWLLHNLI